MGNKISPSAIDRPNIETNQLEPLKLVWLTPENDENLLNILSKITTNIQISHDRVECETLLRDNSQNENIFVILNSEFSQEIVSHIHALNSIICFYIFSSTSNDELLWTQNYSKIRSIIYNADGLIYELSKDRIFFNHRLYSKDFQILKKQNYNRSSCVEVENDSFVCFLLLLTILTDESDSLLPPSSHRSIENIHRFYEFIPETSKLIKELEENYKKDGAIKTLLNITTLARFLDKALYEQNIPVLFHSRFLFADIYNYQLNNRLSSAHTYTIRIMSFDDLKKIDPKANPFIMFKKFLLTSTDLSNLPTMNITDQQLRNVVFEIHAEDKEDTWPFACVEENWIAGDRGKINSKILFMPGSIFQIMSLEKMTDLTWKLKLNLVGHNEFQILADELQKLRTDNNPLIVSDSFDKYGQSDKTIEYLRHLLIELPPNHNLISTLNEKLNMHPNNQMNCLRQSRIIVVKSSLNLNPMASEMLAFLSSISNNSIIVYEDLSHINFDQIFDKQTTLIFAKYDIISSIKSRNTSAKPVLYFIFDDRPYTNKQSQTFANGNDMMYELADELERLYRIESDQDINKKNLANQIEPGMKNIHRKYSSTSNYIHNERPIFTDTIIVYLMLNEHNENMIAKIENDYSNFHTNYRTYYDENEFQSSMLTDNYDASKFVIVVSNDQNPCTIAFQQFNNIKEIYYIQQSLSTSGILNDNSQETFRKLTLKLIDHYNELADIQSFIETNDSIVQKKIDMLSKARTLTDLLKENENIF